MSNHCNNPNLLFNRKLVRLHRDRAARSDRTVNTVMRQLCLNLVDRLDDTTTHFQYALDIGGQGIMASILLERNISVISCDLSPVMAGISNTMAVCMDEEYPPFSPCSFDLIISSFCLHWTNDLLAALVKIRTLLKPKGLFLANIPIFPGLSSLRDALTRAEITLKGGASPRIPPLPTLRDCSELLQRANFALPVADKQQLNLSYRSGLSLLRDLRETGETNALIGQNKTIPSRHLFPLAASLLADKIQDERGRLPLCLPYAILTGWSL